jgi:hypothetical protein
VRGGGRGGGGGGGKKRHALNSKTGSESSLKTASENSLTGGDKESSEGDAPGTLLALLVQKFERNVPVLLYMCPLTVVYRARARAKRRERNVLILLCKCPHTTTVYVSSYYHVSSYNYICVLLLLYTELERERTSDVNANDLLSPVGPSRRSAYYYILLYMLSYCIRVRMLLYMCPPPNPTEAT